MAAVNDRLSDTLITKISYLIMPGTTIIYDRRRACRGKSEGYEHLKLNHKIQLQKKGQL